MLFDKNMVIYEKDIEALGGGVMLEKIIQKGFHKNIYQGIMYLKGRKYRIKIATYRRGKGKIIEIALPGDKELEIQYLLDIYKNALKNNEGNLYMINQARKATKYFSNICIILQIYLILINMHRVYSGVADYGNKFIIIACIILIPLTLIKKERSLRL